MSFDGLHETVVKDVLDIVKDGIDQAESMGFSVRSKNSLASASSLSKATEGLILVFPHLCSMNASFDTAQMLNKAIETKAVSLLQIAFSAFNITNSTDAVSFVKQFHTNIGSGRMSIDKFIDTMDSINLESGIPSLNGHSISTVKQVLEEFSQMECYFEDDLNETSINDYKMVNRYGKYVVTEANPNYKGMNLYKHADMVHQQRQGRYQKQQDLLKNDRAERQLQHQIDNDERNFNYRKDRDITLDKQRKEERKDDREYQRERDQVKDKYDQDRLNNDLQQTANKAAKDEFDMLRQQIIPSDIKKANEMVPTMMVINFVTRDEKLQTVVRNNAVIGIKARLYPATSNDIINKIITKHVDSNTFLKLVRVSTRELNFVKDFLLAIDDAKLAAVSCSTKGSDTNKLLKTLERRALKGKVRKKLNMSNSYKAITTITITKDEADYIKRYNNIDVFSVNVIRKIMESLNIMQFIVADETEECAYIIMDSGDDSYERISYTHLEREATDGSSKKAINLMTKMMN